MSNISKYNNPITPIWSDASPHKELYDMRIQEEIFKREVEKLRQQIDSQVLSEVKNLLTKNDEIEEKNKRLKRKVKAFIMAHEEIEGNDHE